METQTQQFEKELLDIIFDNNKEVSVGPKKVLCKSTLLFGLQNAKFNNRFDKAVVSLILHLIALEQIGNLFCKQQPNMDDNGIVKALAEFEPNLFNPRERQGIKHLRHALAHNFGLACNDKDQKTFYQRENKHRNKRGESTMLDENETNYKYILHFNKENHPIITPPYNDWDGEFKCYSLKDIINKKLNSTTSFQICVPLLIDKVVEIFNKLKEKHQKGELHFVSPNGNDNINNEDLCEIAFKYFIYDYEEEQ